jgi:hypothetical protein
MILVRGGLADFAAFVSATYGAKVTLHPEQKDDELGRFMCQGKFFVIRELPEADVDAATIEVWCSDRELMDDIEEVWKIYLTHDIEDFEGETE